MLLRHDLRWSGATTWTQKHMERWDLVQALQAMRGIKLLTAASIVSEIGDIRRFPSPGRLMSFLGLTPSESSSGQSVQRGSITKAGNDYVRRLMIDAAWAYRASSARDRCTLATAACWPGANIRIG